MKSLFKNLILVFFIGLSLGSFAQTIIEIDGESISKEEFKKVYLKNNTGEIVAKSTVDEYLELYINFKLKVKEAISLGMDKDPVFKRELRGYRSQLAQPYLSETDLMESLKKEAYYRLQEEIRASHILIKCDPKASPADTLKAYRKIMDLRKLAEKEGFAEIAKKYSQDPSAKDNHGDLGYFTGFYMVYPFETAAYNTKVGEVSMPIRTRFGYHIIKVEDRRPSNGTMTAAHILVSNDPELTDAQDPEQRAKEIYARLKKGDFFEELAAQFSDDKRTAKTGGILPPFFVGRMVPEFENAAFALKADGDISEPVESPYGWHIIKRISKEPIGKYDEIEGQIAEKVKKDTRSNLTESAAIKKIKSTYGFKENLKERDDFYALIDSSYFTENWDTTSFKKLNKTLFEIGNKKVNQQDFARRLNRGQRSMNYIDPQVLVNDTYKEFRRKEILAYKDAQLEVEYPEFKALVQEYHDGILLFNLTDKEVWTKAMEDTTGLQSFYEANKESYRWGERANAVVFSAMNQKIIDELNKLLEEGKTEDEALEIINQSSQLNLKMERKKYERGENEFVDKVKWVEGNFETVKDNGRLVYVWIKEVLSPTYKTLSDARGIITSDYQEYLEKQWIASLRDKYNFSVNQEVVESLKQELQ